MKKLYHLKSMIDRIIYNIKNDIKILERNKEISLINNNYKNYCNIKKELESKYKILNIFMEQKALKVI